MLALTLPPEIEARLDDLARETGRDKAEIATEALLEYIDDLEDIHLAEKRLEDIYAGRSQTIPLADVMAEYGLES